MWRKSSRGSNMSSSRRRTLTWADVPIVSPCHASYSTHRTWIFIDAYMNTHCTAADDLIKREPLSPSMLRQSMQQAPAKKWIAMAGESSSGLKPTFPALSDAPGSSQRSRIVPWSRRTRRSRWLDYEICTEGHI